MAATNNTAGKQRGRPFQKGESGNPDGRPKGSRNATTLALETLRRVTKATRREMRRRAAVEPVIGHLKDGHRLRRNYLKGRDGDRINAVLAAAGYNFSLLATGSRNFYASCYGCSVAPSETFFTNDYVNTAVSRLHENDFPIFCFFHPLANRQRQQMHVWYAFSEWTVAAVIGAFQMRTIRIAKYEHELSECSTEVLKQMTELKQLREMVRLAEAANALDQPEGLFPSNPKIVDPLAGFQLRDQPERPPATTGPSL